MSSGLIARPVARRIDRASRAAHRFHRFAHHPLCGQYAAEVVVWGRLRVCRGCTYAALGGAAGVGVGLLLHSPSLGGACLLTAVALLVASRLARLPKALSRLAFAVAVGGALTSSLATSVLALAVGAGFIAAYRRRGPHRAPCASCPERAARVCSGFAPMVRRERAFVRLTQRWL